MKRHDLITKAMGIPWFHAINFGDYVSPGRFTPDKTPNSTLLPVFSFLKNIFVANTTCLDIGTADGLTAFTLKDLGARHVIATDGRPQGGFEIASNLLDMDIEYYAYRVSS